ncbi:MAG: 2-succinyl-5-enolpyruvyl-6-hydroxy-3-cyclohexene-1-carboxylic-acid synthase, partial [Longimicrobiales bacterium]|nr:2-succinyl-5-enolpyruvyl-6-hydroxy-3-cyclohexene-1-carboxylic-acid synthase [Longimicrobiales bacterium]
MSDANRNQVWARALLDELARSGVRHVVLAPGSRSTPLVLAAHAHGGLALHLCLDERSAAFFALGIGRASGHPAAVITTSGTAVANLLPAAVEADRAEVPLLLVTADRPRELRDADANQSVTQPGLFATCARAAWDLMHAELTDDALRHLRGVACRAVAAARGPGAGPVHVNVPLRKPLEPEAVETDRAATAALDAEAREGRAGGAPWVRIERAPATPASASLERVRARVAEAARPLVVAGHLPVGAGETVRRAAAALGMPILADPLSGVRFGPGGGAPRVTVYDTLLRDAELARSLEPDLIVQLGRTPTSAVTARWLAGCGAVRIVIDDGPLWKDHRATAHEVIDAAPAETLAALASGIGVREAAGDEARATWHATWHTVEEAARAVYAGDLASDELAVARAAVEHTPAGVPLFVSSSMPIRDVDTISGADERALPIFGNRGASG